MNNISNKEKNQPEPLDNSKECRSSYTASKCQWGFKKATTYYHDVINHKYCSSIYEASGMWYMCLLCGPIPVGSGRPFTNGRWYEHLNSEFHKKKERHHEHLERNKATESAKVGLVNENSIL